HVDTQMPRIDFDEVLRAGLPDLAQVEPPAPITQPTPAESSGFADYVLDIPRGIASGVTGFGQSVGSLVETPFELAGLDIIDDSVWDATPFKTKTWVGSLTDGVTQFATAFIPIAGQLSKVGLAGRVLGTAGKAARVAGYLDAAVLPGAVA